MSSRLAFQTQLASIMEVLANAAVAEICKLVDDDYALVSLQMSQCQRENKALKRKLHLLELKMARGAAERRLRDGATSGGRTRVQLAGGDRLRDATAADGGAFERQVEASVWPAGAAGDGPGEPLLSEGPHNQSPDVELVEPEALLVKEERLEPNMSQEEDAEEDLRLIRDDGILECARGAAAERPAFQPQDTHNHSVKGRGDGRGVEKLEEPDVVLVKVEEGEPGTGGAAANRTGLSIQEGLVESSTDNYQGVLPFDETSSNQLSDLHESGRGFSELTKGGSKDPSSVVAVQLRVADTNTPSNPNALQPRSSSSDLLNSDYSLFELETFFTRWAPEGVFEGSSASMVSQPPWSRTQIASSQVATSRTLSSTRSPQGPAPPGGSAASPNGVEMALAAQHQADLLARHINSQAAAMIPNERRMKRFVCRTCGKAFSGLSNLEAHERVHTGEKPFRCVTCGKRFSEAGNLKKHQRVHTGEKPFSCEQCGKRFAWICNLRTHQQSATGCGPAPRPVTHS